MYFFCYSIVSSKFTHHNAIFCAKNKGKGRWLACGLACLWGLPLAVWLVLCLEANHFGNTVGSELLDGLVVIFWVLGRQLACGPPPLGTHSGYGFLLGSAGLPPKQDTTLVRDLIGLPCQCKAIVLIATKAKEAWQRERSGLEEGRWRWRTPYPSISQVVIVDDSDSLWQWQWPWQPASYAGNEICIGTGPCWYPMSWSQ